MNAIAVIVSTLFAIVVFGIFGRRIIKAETAELNSSEKSEK